MATLEITEYALAPTVNGNVAPVPFGEALGHKEVAVGAVSAASAAFTGGTQLIVVVSDVACRIAVGAAPVAGNTATQGGGGAAKTRRLVADAEAALWVRPGFKIAAIAL